MLLVPNAILRPKKEMAKVLMPLPMDRRAAVQTALDASPAASRLDGLTGIFVRFKEIRILDNHASLFGIWDRAADIYPIVMVVSDAASQPYQISFQSVFNGVEDNQCLPIANGLDIARSYSQIPRFLDIHVVVMKSNEGTRDIGKAVNQAITSDDGKNMISALDKAITGANPIAGTVVTVATSLLSLVTGYLAQEKDEQIFYGVASFEDDPDDLGIGDPKVLTDQKNALVVFEVVGQTRTH